MARKAGKKRSKPATSSAGSGAVAQGVVGGGWSSLPWKALATTLAANAASTEKKTRPRQHHHEEDSNEQRQQDDAVVEVFDEDDVGYNHYDDSDADSADLYGDDSSSAAKADRVSSKRRKKSPVASDVMNGANDPGILFGFEVVDGSQYEVKMEKVGRDGAEVSRVVPRIHTHDDDNDVPSAKSRKDSTSSDKARTKGSSNTRQGDDDKSKGSDSDGSSAADDKEDLADIKKEIRRLKKKAKRKEAKLRKRREKRQQQKKLLEGSTEGDKGEIVEGEGDKRDEADTTASKKAAAATKSDRMNKGKSSSADTTDPQQPQTQPTPDQIDSIRTSWSIAAPGVYLHETLCKGLALQDFITPTPIQSAALPASILGRRDVVGAAPTGSGKTLAYALPMLQGILEGRDERRANDAKGAAANKDNANEDEDDNADVKRREYEALTGLVLCPTRELAVQVTSEIKKVGCNEVGVGAIVGGLAEQKQKRILDKKKPPILVATPGRLWELISSNDHPHLMDLSHLQYLVVDEADRMVKQGSFPQLAKIFDAINKANPPLSPEDMNVDDEDDDDDPDRLRSLPGIRGEAKVTMLDDKLLAMIRKQEGRDDHVSGDEEESPPEAQEMDDEEYLQQQKMVDEELLRQQDEDDEDVDEPVHRQTFVYSATLTLPPSSHHLLKTAESSATNARKDKKRKKAVQTVEGAIAEILEKAGAQGQTKVVDLTTSKSENDVEAKDTGKKNAESSKDKKVQKMTKLPPGLSLYQVKCTQMHKDMHLYAYLTTTKVGSSGPCLVFCNSIAAVRRISETLKVLGLPVRPLHAQMAQKARMSALESIKKPKSRSIVVATDVAARGLDISSIATVVHYDVPRTIDTFVHRAGRTARGLGDKAVGSSISLVSSNEERSQRAICEALHGSASAGFETVQMDGRLLSAAQERTNLAARIVECENIESKASKKNKWFIEAAADAGLDLDEELLDEGLMGGDHRDRQKLSEARKARQRLSELLAQPMRTQQFGKFLSGAGMQAAIEAENEVSPYVVEEPAARAMKQRKKKRKKKGGG